MASKHAVRCLVVALAFGLCSARGASGEQAMPVIEVDEGVSWALAGHRAATLSDLRYPLPPPDPPRAEGGRLGDGRDSLRVVRSRGPRLGRGLQGPVPGGSRRCGRTARPWTGRPGTTTSSCPPPPCAPTTGTASSWTSRRATRPSTGTTTSSTPSSCPTAPTSRCPLFDQPNLKARFELTLEAPAGWVAVANGETLEAPDGGDADGPATWRFAETQPIPTYLFAFAAGRFQIEEGRAGGPADADVPPRDGRREGGAQPGRHLRPARRRPRLARGLHGDSLSVRQVRLRPRPPLPVRGHGAPRLDLLPRLEPHAGRVGDPGRVSGAGQPHRPRDRPHVVRRPRHHELVRRRLDEGGVRQLPRRQDRAPLVPRGGPRPPVLPRASPGRLRHRPHRRGQSHPAAAREPEGGGGALRADHLPEGADRDAAA